MECTSFSLGNHPQSNGQLAVHVAVLGRVSLVPELQEHVVFIGCSVRVLPSQ